MRFPTVYCSTGKATLWVGREDGGYCLRGSWQQTAVAPGLGRRQRPPDLVFALHRPTRPPRLALQYTRNQRIEQLSPFEIDVIGPLFRNIGEKFKHKVEVRRSLARAKGARYPPRPSRAGQLLGRRAAGALLCCPCLLCQVEAERHAVPPPRLGVPWP